MANLNEGFQQVKLDDAGTYGAYNAGTSQGIAFPDQNSFSNFFGSNASFDQNAPKASFDTSGLLGSNAGQVKAITLGNLAPATSLNVPQATPTADPLAGTTAGAQQTSKSLQDYIKELTPPASESSKQYDVLTEQLNTLLPGLTGRGEAQLNAEQQAGITQQKQALASLNSQILQKVAEANQVSSQYEQINAALENQSIPTNILFGQQAQVRKQQLAESNSKSADIGLLQARAQGLQGNLQAAQESVNRAIDLKYQDRESTVNLKMQQLQLLEGKLNKEEAITAKAIERKYNEEQAKIAEEKAKAKENISLAFSGNVQTKYANKGGEWYRVSDGHSFATPEELFKDAGITSFEQAYQRGLVTDLNASRLADIDFVSQLRAKYPDAGISINDSANTATQKLNNSRIYKEETRPPQYSGGGGGGAGTLTGTNIIDKSTDGAVKAIIASRPGDGGYGDTYNAVKAKFGEGVANSYDQVYQSVFNKGASVDAAFNDAKVASQVKPPTQAQATASGYTSRLVDSNSVILDQTKSINTYNPIGFSAQLKLPSYLQSPIVQQQQQAERNFVNAVLRRESGAAISQSEFDNAIKQYFPRPGDSSGTLSQKARNRDAVITSLKQASGNAYQEAGASSTVTSPDGAVWKVNPDGSLTQIQ